MHAHYTPVFKCVCVCVCKMGFTITFIRIIGAVMIISECEFDVCIVHEDEGKMMKMI